MKHLKYLPLAFLAGVHGFAILAPYLGLCAAVHALSVQRRRRLVLVSVSADKRVAVTQ
jgi:hypothetical protein